MPLESVTHIADLNVSNPPGTDTKAQGDDHIRNIKTALKTDLATITGPITATLAQINALGGATVDGQILRRVAGAIQFGPMSIIPDVRTSVLNLPDTTLITGLTVALEIGRYAIEGFISYQSIAADDLKVKMAGSATYTAFAMFLGSTPQALTEATTLVVQSSGSPEGAAFQGMINCTVAGTYILQFAKNADTGADGCLHRRGFAL
jgi:hypothetical protein